MSEKQQAEKSGRQVDKGKKLLSATPNRKDTTPSPKKKEKKDKEKEKEKEQETGKDKQEQELKERVK